MKFPKAVRVEFFKDQAWNHLRHNYIVTMPKKAPSQARIPGTVADTSMPNTAA